MSNPVCNRCGESILPIRKVNLSIRSPKDHYKAEYDVCEVCFEIALIFMNGTLLEDEERIKSTIKKSFEGENLEKTLADEIKDLDNVLHEEKCLEMNIQNKLVGFPEHKERTKRKPQH